MIIKMFFSSVVLVISLCCTSLWATDAQIYQEAQRLQALSGTSVAFSISETEWGSYTSWDDGVVIARNDINICNQDVECVATIIAHEIGHVKLGHLTIFKADVKSCEKQADLYSVHLLSKAGYSPYVVPKHMKRFREARGDRKLSTHPTWSERIRITKQEADIIA